MYCGETAFDAGLYLSCRLASKFATRIFAKFIRPCCSYLWRRAWFWRRRCRQSSVLHRRTRLRRRWLRVQWRASRPPSTRNDRRLLSETTAFNTDRRCNTVINVSCRYFTTKKTRRNNVQRKLTLKGTTIAWRSQLHVILDSTMIPGERFASCAFLGNPLKELSEKFRITTTDSDRLNELRDVIFNFPSRPIFTSAYFACF